MSQAPYMPVFTDALLGDTTHLNTEEFGAYCLLLFATWNNKGVALRDDPDRLSRVVRCGRKKWLKLREVLASFFDLSEGTWRQRRLEKEWKHASAQVAAQSARGQAGNEKRWSRPEASTGNEENDKKPPSPRTPPGSPTALKNNETGIAGAIAPKPNLGEAKEKERFKNLEGISGRCAPSGARASAETEQPPEEPLSATERAEIEQAFDQALAAVRGHVPKGIRDAAAYESAVASNKFRAFLRELNSWASGNLDGMAREGAWQAIADAENAGSRKAMAPATRKAIDAFDKMRKAASPEQVVA
jgi:uncharacterized protein YdaU (DUF1376 family)